MTDWEKLSQLIKQRNHVDDEIASIINRPALQGHIGEFIASRIFNINLHQSATKKGNDGFFNKGSLVGKSVNIKWYGKKEGILDINPNSLPDYFLVLCGPKSNAQSSVGKSRPLKIDSVYLFESNSLIDNLRSRGVKIGIATSVVTTQWELAEIFPNQTNHFLELSPEQRSLLSLFS